MHKNADIVITAWEGKNLVGLSRAISDFCYCCYLSDLCVSDKHRKEGIGHKLVELTKEKLVKNVSSFCNPHLMPLIFIRK